MVIEVVIFTLLCVVIVLLIALAILKSLRNWMRKGK